MIVVHVTMKIVGKKSVTSAKGLKSANSRRVHEKFKISKQSSIKRKIVIFFFLVQCGGRDVGGQYCCIIM